MLEGEFLVKLDSAEATRKIKRLIHLTKQFTKELEKNRKIVIEVSVVKVIKKKKWYQFWK